MLSIPRLQLHLTERCNLACSYCYARSARPESDMTWETAQAAIAFYLDEFSDGLSQVTISFFGGEPLLKWQLIQQIVPYAVEAAAQRGKEARFSITTNGTLVRADVANYFRRHGYAMLVSWDGAPGTQDRYRVLADATGSARLMARALPHIRSVPDAGVRMTWSGETLPMLADNVRFFADAGFDWVGFAPLDNMTFHESLLAEYRRQIIAIAELWSAELAQGRILYINPLLAMIGRVMGRPEPLHFHMHRCDPLQQRISVACDGTLYPCHRFLARADARIGSIWDRELDPAVLKRFASLNAGGIDGCLALADRVEGDQPCYVDGLVRMMEVSVVGSELMLRRGAEILDGWPPERIPALARALLSDYREWRTRAAA